MDIRAKVLTAIRWTAAARVVGQIISWVITIVVIRILSPSDYGLMAMAMVLLSFLYLVNDLGLEAVLVQKKDLSEQARRQIFGIVIVGNLTIFIGLQFAAPLIAAFFREESLIPIIRVLAFQFPLFMLEQLPLAKLERELDFKRRSLVDLATVFSGGLVTLGLAVAGMGVWALVWGNLVTIASRMVGVNIIAPCLCFPEFSWRGMRESFSFGSFVTADKAFWFVFAESDKFIGGRILGKELLGVYVAASHIATLPINKIAGLIKSVAFPAFSQVQTDVKAVVSYLLKAVRIMGLVVFPVFFGISSVAPELVAVVLGEKWLDAVIPLQILAVIMPARMISVLFPPVLWGISRPGVSAANYLVAASTMPLFFMIGVQWGARGLAMAWLLGYPLVFLFSVFRTTGALDMTVTELLAELRWPGLAAALMYASVIGTRHYLPVDMHQGAVLLCLVVVGCIVYTVTIFSLNREGCREAFDIVRG